MLLKGRSAVITGAASERGLGLATARLFAEHGARVAILDLDTGAAQAAAKSLRGRGHFGMKCDVAKARDCERAVDRAIRRFGHVDMLVNNAGITSPKPFAEVTKQDYERIMDINLRGTFQMCQAVVGHMRERKSGAIVNLSSVSAQRGGGIFGGSAYSASKAGVLGLTKALARELAPDSIRVNAICPSFIDTDIMGDRRTPELIERIVAGVPLGRAGTAAEVAGCALFLASDLSSYVTGIELDVNGGSHIH
ncbi:SDR family NAD(P)-dependent oxidoreductase [Microbaculum marinum]|uniref:SDR family NAD(P)-dependent oxidoreductase n=1 Tax=Microbaculum marinum TaxID=1764581 RepID=A0AAW9RTV4_9HYPH